MKLPVFDSELITIELMTEIVPLLAAHWKEVAHFKDIPLNPDYEFYKNCQMSGNLRVFTMREDGLLRGYAIFLIRRAPHYMTSVQANQDVLYVDPALRGVPAIQFLNYCHRVLGESGVQAVYHHVKTAHDFGPVLKRLGFTHVEEIYTMRLDQES